MVWNRAVDKWRTSMSLLIIRPVGTVFHENLIKIQELSITDLHVYGGLCIYLSRNRKIIWKWRPIRLDLHVLKVVRCFANTGQTNFPVGPLKLPGWRLWTSKVTWCWHVTRGSIHYLVICCVILLGQLPGMRFNIPIRRFIARSSKVSEAWDWVLMHLYSFGI